MFSHPRSQARSPNWLFPKNLEHLSLLPSLSTFRLSITIFSYKVQTALTYSSYSLLPAPVSLPCLTHLGELPVVDDYVRTWLGRLRNKQRWWSTTCTASGSFMEVSNLLLLSTISVADDWSHQDLTTSNILFRLLPHVIKWSDAEVYAHQGVPEMENVRTRDRQPPGPHAPAMLVAPMQDFKMSDATLLQESIVVGDFGQSYIIASPPSSYEPGTALNYQSPEARFEGRVGLEADIWALGCAIFEIRAGFALFELFLGNDVDILRQMVETLGRLPDPWWAAYKQRALWFEEDGQPKSEQDQERAGVLLKAYRSSIRAKLLEIGEQDDPPSEDEGPMIERPGVRLHEEEVGLLEDLLEKMMKYNPEERIRIQDVVRHPWFTWGFDMLFALHRIPLIPFLCMGIPERSVPKYKNDFDSESEDDKSLISDFMDWPQNIARL